jgi:hypothetical protein
VSSEDQHTTRSRFAVLAPWTRRILQTSPELRFGPAANDAVPTSGPDASRPGSGGAVRPRLVVLAAVLATASLIALWGWWSGAELRAVRHLAPEQRRAFCERTLANVRELCSPRSDRPRELCRAQATLLLGLDECQADCQAVARAEVMADSAVK